MNEQTMIETVGKLDIAESYKRSLIERAQAGDPGALRAITAKKKQQDADRARAVAAAVPTP